MKNPIKRMFNVYDERSLNNIYRRKRFRFFLSQLEKLKSDKRISILDIGGTQSFWGKMNFTESEKVHITILNLHKEKIRFNNFSSIQNDACNLSGIKDKEFDIVHSIQLLNMLVQRKINRKWQMK